MTGYPRGWGDLPLTLQGEFIHHLYLNNIYYPTYNIINQPMKPYDSTHWGIELIVANRLWERNKKKIAICKTSRDGSSIDGWGSENPFVLTIVLQDYANMKADLISKGYNPIFKGVVFDQGEYDCNHTLQEAQNWLTLFDSFISKLGIGLGETVTNDKIILRKLSVYQAPEIYIYSNIVRNYQEIVGARPGVRLINSDSFHLYTDNIHFDAEGIIQYGNAIADVILEQPINNSWLNQEFHETTGDKSYSLTGTAHGTISGTLTNFRDATIDVIEPKALTKGCSVWKNGTILLVVPYGMDGQPLSINPDGFTKDADYPNGVTNGLLNIYTVPVDATINDYLPNGDYNFTALDVLNQSINIAITKTENKNIGEITIRAKQ
jgi:hypothetical protein